jgi:hypothetical protein
MMMPKCAIMQNDEVINYYNIVQIEGIARTQYLLIVKQSVKNVAD